MASRRAASNWLSASAMPITMIAGEDQPPHQPQPRGGHRRELAAGHGHAQALAAPRQRAVHELGDHEREHDGAHRVDLLAVVLYERGGVEIDARHDRLCTRRRASARRWRVFAATRAAVLLVAVFAALSFGPATGGLAAENAQKFDEPSLTHPLGGLGDTLFSPLARWDASGTSASPTTATTDSEARAAFFPLYPLLVARSRASSAAAPTARC